MKKFLHTHNEVSGTSKSNSKDSGTDKHTDGQSRKHYLSVDLYEDARKSSKLTAVGLFSPSTNIDFSLPAFSGKLFEGGADLAVSLVRKRTGIIGAEVK